MTRISRFSFASLLLKKILFSAWISFMFINIDIIVEVQGVSDIFFLSMLGRELVDWYALHINNISANKNKHLCWCSVIISFSFFKLTIWSLMINFCRCCWHTNCFSKLVQGSVSAHQIAATVHIFLSLFPSLPPPPRKCIIQQLFRTKINFPEERWALFHWHAPPMFFKKNSMSKWGGVHFSSLWLQYVPCRNES